MCRTSSAVVPAVFVACALLAAGCGRASSLADMAVGSRIAVETTDGRAVVGPLVEMGINHVAVVDKTGTRHELARDRIAEAYELEPGKVCAP
jgi:hypothetical protein